LSVTTLINDNDIEHERGISNRAIDLSNLRRRKIAYHYRRAKLFKYIYTRIIFLRQNTGSQHVPFAVDYQS